MTSRRRDEDRRSDRDRARRDDTRHRTTEAESTRARYEARRAEDVIMEEPRSRGDYGAQRAPDARIDSRIDSRTTTRSSDTMDMSDDYYGARSAREPVTSPPIGRAGYPERDDFSRGQSQPFYEIETPRNANYKEYFLPEEGINREVLQNELTAYLSGDATSRPYTMPDV